MILNGRDGTVPTYAEVVSASGGKTNGNVMVSFVFLFFQSFDSILELSVDKFL